MKRALIALAVVAALGAILYFSIRGGGDRGEKVYVEPAQPRRIEAVVTAPGEVDPRVKVNISSHVVGKIDKLYFKEGDTVRKGQKLVEVEKQVFIAQRDRMRAEIANRRIEVTRAKSALATAQLAYNRATRMREQGIQAQELFDRAALDYENAKAAYGSAEEGVRQGAASLTEAENELTRTTIVSPIDGKVVQLNAHEGEVVVTGTMNNPGSIIAVIADLSEILVEAQVGETEVVAIRAGEPAKIKVDAVADKEYAGRVTEIGSSAAVRANAGSGVRYFLVKVAIDNPDERLRPGMTSQVSIITSTAGDSLAVPIQSVVERVPGATKDDEEEGDAASKRKYVFVVRDGKVHQTEVTTGISNAIHVTIRSGLKAGDPIVTGPFRTIKTLHDGDPAKIAKEEKRAAEAK